MDWNQIRAILWLRWHLTKNQWSRGGKVNAVLGIVFIVVGCTAGAAGGFVGLLAGALAMKNTSPLTMLLVWDALIGIFLFFWTMGIITEIQRSETIDLARLLHLPVSLRDVFIVNYLASHVNLVIILSLPAMLGLSIGLALGRSWSMILLLPLVLGFVFMITAWTYCLRGWLVRLMINKRRRRTIIAVITITVVLLGQLPNLYINVLHGHALNPSDRQMNPSSSINSLADTNTLVAAHKVVPFLWLSNGAMSLAQGSGWPAIFGVAGTFLLGGLGLARAYQTTVRFYHGSSAVAAVKHLSEKEKAVAAKGNLIEKRIPLVPEEASVLAMTFFRCLTRAPEVKMGLASNFIILMILGSVVLLRNSSNVGDNYKPFIAAGAIAFTFFGMTQLLFNQFGFDRSGFRSLVLLPVPRKYILLGKNLALMPFAVGIGVIFLVVIKFAVAASSLVIFAAALQSVAAFLLLSIAGNLFSVLAPYRIAVGSLKPTKVPPLITVAIIVSHVLFPIFMFPIFLPPLLGLLCSLAGWLPAAPINLFFSVILLVTLILAYKFSLRTLGNLLQQREKQILQVVTQEIE